ERLQGRQDGDSAPRQGRAAWYSRVARLVTPMAWSRQELQCRLRVHAGGPQRPPVGITSMAEIAEAGGPAERRSGILAALGPGLITGASDDDPSGIATYSQAGAQFGYSLGWTLLLSYPLMAAIQLISARIGRVTGRGIAGNIRRHYPSWLLHLLVGLV